MATTVQLHTHPICPHCDNKIRALEAKVAELNAGESVRIRLAQELEKSESALASSREEVERFKGEYGDACRLVALMHAAAVGEVTGPTRGVIEDIADLKANYDQAQAALKAVKSIGKVWRDNAENKALDLDLTPGNQVQVSILMNQVSAWDASLRPTPAAETGTDLSKCSYCGGRADQGHDREDPPNVYACSKCNPDPRKQEARDVGDES